MQRFVYIDYNVFAGQHCIEQMYLTCETFCWQMIISSEIPGGGLPLKVEQGMSPRFSNMIYVNHSILNPCPTDAYELRKSFDWLFSELKAR